MLDCTKISKTICIRTSVENPAVPVYVARVRAGHSGKSPADQKYDVKNAWHLGILKQTEMTSLIKECGGCGRFIYQTQRNAGIIARARHVHEYAISLNELV